MSSGEEQGAKRPHRSLASLAIARPVTTLMALAAVTLMGILSWRELPVQLLPSFALPQVWVQAFRNGASPEAMEDDVLRPLEGELALVGGIEEIASTADQGSASIRLSFSRDTDLDYAAIKVRERVESAQARLPDQTFVQVQRFDTSQYSNFVMVLSFRGDADQEAMKRMADDIVVPRLSGVEGVVQVTAQGGASVQVGAFVDPDRARSRGVSVVQVRQALASATQPVVSVGAIDDGTRRLPVVLDGRARRLQDLADAPVDATGKVRVSHVADIQPGLAGSTERYRVNGQTSVGLYVFKDQQSNLIDVAHRLRARVDEFNREREGTGLSLHADMDAAKEIEDRLKELRERALVGALLALLVLLVFLRDPRPVVVVALAVPASLLLAACFFREASLSLNILSLLGLALAIGLLLDNSIVVLEAIAARRERGDDPRTAAARGAAQVQRAVVSSTIATIVVFVPLFVLNSEYSPLFKELATSVSLPLVASLLVALTVVPLLVSRIPGGAGETEVVRLPGKWGLPRPGLARSAYSAVLRLCLRHPLATIGSFLGLVVLSLVFGVPLLAVFASAPRPEAERIELVAKLPPGSDTEATDEVARQMEDLLKDVPELDEVRASVRDREARVTVVFKKKEEREGPVDVEAVRKRLREQARDLPDGVEMQVDPPPTAEEQGGGADPFGQAGTRETVRVVGPPGPELRSLADTLREQLAEVPGVEAVTSDLEASRPTLEIRADRRRLAEYGLSTTELMGVVWATRREGEAARYPFRMGEEDVDVVLWIEGADQRSVEKVRDFPLTTASGARVPLSAVASVSTGSEPPKITRFQRDRAITLSYGFSRAGRASGDATKAVRASVDRLVAGLELPPGCHVDVEHADESVSILWKMVGIAAALVLMVLAMTFESVVLAALVMLCAPLAIIGVVWVLVLSGTGLDQFVMLAFIVLLGVVVNHGILFVDRSQALMAEGCRRPAAILRASHDRLRPILMTTATAVVGMLPLAIAKGGSNEIWPPFARAVIGGLSASTLLSLVFIPAGALAFGWLTDLLRTLGREVTAVTTLAAVAFLWWAYSGAGIVETMPMRVVLVAPVWLLFIAIARALQVTLRNERPPDIVGEAGVRLRVHNVRKIYGGWPRVVRDHMRRDRWEKMARAAGLEPSQIDTPTEARHRLTWQLGVVGLLVYVHIVATSGWGIFLMGLPFLVLANTLPEAALACLRRPGRWPPKGWLGRAWNALLPLGLWGYLFVRRRQDSEADIATLVFAGLILVFLVATHLWREGGWRALLARFIAPAPVVALDGVSLTFENGLYGLLGPNGAGKSTLMRLAVNLYSPSRGMLTVNDYELAKNAPSLQQRIGYLPQSFGLPPRLNARQYLHHQALLAGRLDIQDRTRLVDSVLAEVGLNERADEKLGGFSGGMRQRVGIARTLLNVPRIVVVDEPTVGLDPRERIRFRNLLAELAKTRIVLLSTHVVDDIGSACREVIVLDKGRVLFRGSVAELVETGRGRAWLQDVQEARLVEFSRQHRVVSTTSLPGSIVRVKGVGEPPEGAELAQPTLEDAYLLLLGRPPREVLDAA